MRGRSTWTGLALALALLAAGAPHAGAQDFGPSAFSQLTGTRGCLAQVGYDVGHDCQPAGGLADARGVGVSPDDRFVYVTSGGTVEAGSNGVATFARAADGGLTPAGCITADAGDGRVGTEGACARGDALVGATDIAFSPDGATAYVASGGSGALAWFSRDAVTGALTPAGCVKDIPRRDRCAEVPLLGGAAAVALSPDGRDVYVAANGTSSVHLLRRDPPSGGLTRVQCVSQTGSDGACDPAGGLRGVIDLAVAPDGRALYTASTSGAVTTFARDPETGRLTRTGCLLADAPQPGPCAGATGIDGAEGVAVSPDGRDVYVASTDAEAVTSFRVQPDGALRQTGCLRRVSSDEPADEEDDEEETDFVEARDAQAGDCRAGTAIWAPRVVTVSADGRTVFAGGSDTITSYRRDPADGTLTQTGCAEEEQTSPACLTVRATQGVNAIAASADGRNVYVTADDENAVAILGAAVAVASRSVRAGRRGSVRIALTCPAVRNRDCVGRVRAGGGASRRFRLHVGHRAGVSVPLARRARRALGRRGALRVEVRATDALLSPTTRRVTVRRAAGR